MQGNVKDPQFGLDFFRRFSLVLSGLDNLEARRHVNRLCLAAGVPLVESGTAGYLGQVGRRRGRGVVNRWAVGHGWAVGAWMRRGCGLWASILLAAKYGIAGQSEVQRGGVHESACADTHPPPWESTHPTPPLPRLLPHILRSYPAPPPPRPFPPPPGQRARGRRHRVL